MTFKVLSNVVDVILAVSPIGLRGRLILLPIAQFPRLSLEIWADDSITV